MIKALIQDEGGASAIFIALSLSAVVGLVALGIDTARAVVVKRHLQANADAAALAAALALRSSPGRSPSNAALALLKSRGFDPAVIRVEWPPQAGAYPADPAAVRVTLTRSIPGPFALLTGIGSEGVTVVSVARLNVRKTGCLLSFTQPVAMNPGAQLISDGCGELESRRGTLALFEADPWRSLPLPSMMMCGISGGVPGQIIPPGNIRCNGITIDTGNWLHLNPGVHLIGDDLRVKAGGTLSGTGVTLVLANGADILFDPGSNVKLSAPKLGAYAGLVMASSRDGAGSGELLAGAGQLIEGAVHLPARNLHVSGTAQASCTLLVANRIRLSGTVRLASDCAGLGIKPLMLQEAQIVE